MRPTPASTMNLSSSALAMLIYIPLSDLLNFTIRIRRWRLRLYLYSVLVGLVILIVSWLAGWVTAACDSLRATYGSTDYAGAVVVFCDERPHLDTITAVSLVLYSIIASGWDGKREFSVEEESCLASGKM